VDNLGITPKTYYNSDMKETPKEYKKSPNLKTTAGRYFIAKQRAKTKKEACEMIGYNPSNVAHLEDTKTYQEIEKTYYSDALLKQVTIEDIAKRTAQIILQGKDADSNVAIKNALERIEPETSPEKEDRVLVILKG
jgi:hypothetical protein